MDDSELKLEMLYLQANILIEETVWPFLKDNVSAWNLFSKYSRLKELIRHCQNNDFQFLDWHRLDSEGLLTKMDKKWFREEAKLN